MNTLALDPKFQTGPLHAETARGSQVAVPTRSARAKPASREDALDTLNELLEVERAGAPAESIRAQLRPHRAKKEAISFPQFEARHA